MVFACACTRSQDQSSTNDMKANIPLSIQCVGRLEIALPSPSSAAWNQEVGVFSIERQRSADRLDFFRQVEAREQDLHSQNHEKEGYILRAAEDIGGLRVLFYRSSPVDIYTYNVEAYMWPGNGGYRLSTTVATGEKPQVPALLDFVKDMHPIGAGAVAPSGAFCLDGLYLDKGNQRLLASMQATIREWHGARAWVSVLENENSLADEALDIHYDIERERNAAKDILAEDPSAASDPGYPKTVKSLRDGTRDLDGMPGQELVWKKVLNSGVEVYHLRWQTDTAPNGVTVGMDVGDEDDPVPSPRQEEIIALWDAILSTLRQR